MGFVFAGIILYFVIVEAVFVEFYKRKELALYYERENVKWMGLALISMNVIMSVWMPLLQDISMVRTMTYTGMIITIIYNLILLVFGILYRLRMKKQQFDISLSNWVIPVILFLMGSVIAARYVYYGSQIDFTAADGLYNSLIYMLSGDGYGGYLDNKIRMYAVAAGSVLSVGQMINYVYLTQIWKQKEWNRKKELRSILAMGLIFILLCVSTFLPYGRYSVLDLFEARTNQGRNNKFQIDTATIGIDFEKEGGQLTYFKINSADGIDELLDRLSKIRIDEVDGKTEESEGRKCFIHLRGEMVFQADSIWGGENLGENYWQITLNENGSVYYGEDTSYEIKGRVDWDGLYELALSEYNGVNLELYKQWLGQ